MNKFNRGYGIAKPWTPDINNFTKSSVVGTIDLTDYLDPNISEDKLLIKSDYNQIVIALYAEEAYKDHDNKKLIEQLEKRYDIGENFQSSYTHVFQDYKKHIECLMGKRKWLIKTYIELLELLLRMKDSDLKSISKVIDELIDISLFHGRLDHHTKSDIIFITMQLGNHLNKIFSPPKYAYRVTDETKSLIKTLRDYENIASAMLCLGEEDYRHLYLNSVYEQAFVTQCRSICNEYSINHPESVYGMGSLEIVMFIIFTLREKWDEYRIIKTTKDTEAIRRVTGLNSEFSKYHCDFLEINTYDGIVSSGRLSKQLDDIEMLATKLTFLNKIVSEYSDELGIHSKFHNLFNNITDHKIIGLYLSYLYRRVESYYRTVKKYNPDIDYIKSPYSITPKTIIEDGEEEIGIEISAVKNINDVLSILRKRDLPKPILEESRDLVSESLSLKTKLVLKYAFNLRQRALDKVVDVIKEDCPFELADLKEDTIELIDKYYLEQYYIPIEVGGCHWCVDDNSIAKIRIRLNLCVGATNYPVAILDSKGKLFRDTRMTRLESLHGRMLRRNEEIKNETLKNIETVSSLTKISDVKKYKERIESLISNISITDVIKNIDDSMEFYQYLLHNRMLSIEQKFGNS